jgi:molybdenum cofactor cytidylyltransferase
VVRRVLEGRGDAAIAVCRYDDGIGHPFAFARDTFADLAGLHGDKGARRLLDRRAGDMAEVAIAGRNPADVDTEEDSDRVLAELREAR